MCVWEGTQIHMNAQNVTGLIGKNKVIHEGLKSHD